jgi:hypothetical protein
MNKDNSISYKYIVLTGISVILTWLLHEFSHWSMGSLLGNKMIMTLNQSFPVSGEYKEDWHYQLISAAGPIVTIMEAVVIYLIMKHRHKAILYSTLFACFMCRFGATLLTFRNPNDEARISQYFGFGTFTLPVIVTLFLLILLVATSLKYKFSLRFIVLNFFLVTFFISCIVAADKYTHWQLI